MTDAFEAFGRVAAALENATVIAGRNAFQASSEGEIVRDVVGKLRLRPDHRLLEVGCGVGVLLSPLAGVVREAVGVDHPAVIARYRESGVPGNVSLVPGRWPDVSVRGPFDRILAYSVLHYLADVRACESFVFACVEALASGGLLLLGDIPNRDAMERFRSSPSAADIQARYEAMKASCDDPDSLAQRRIFEEVEVGEAFLTDRFLVGLLGRLRGEGLEAYLLPQPSTLPFSETREDLLIRRRA